jgi:flagellar protein FlaH
MTDDLSQNHSIISSGNPELDSKMGGGIPVGSLMLIEGGSGSGKSVLSQQLIFGSLKDGFRVALFTTENTVKSLISQMQSIDLDVLDFLLLGRFKAYPIELAYLGERAPGELLQAIRTAHERDIVVVDSLTPAVTHAADGTQILRFFEGCKRLCASGKTVIIMRLTGNWSAPYARCATRICNCAPSRTGSGWLRLWKWSKSGALAV